MHEGSVPRCPSGGHSHRTTRSAGPGRPIGSQKARRPRCSSRRTHPPQLEESAFREAVRRPRWSAIHPHQRQVAPGLRTRPHHRAADNRDHRNREPPGEGGIAYLDVHNNIDIPPPGDFIREELEARGWLQRDLAYVLGVPEQSVNMLVAGKRGVTADMARALGDAFDVAPEFFLNLQTAFDLSRAKRPASDVARRARLQSAIPRTRDDQTRLDSRRRCRSA